MKPAKLKDRTPKELEQLYSMINDEISKMEDIIQQKSGYYATGSYSLLGDELNKTVEIDMSIAMLEAPHCADESKIKHYIRNNPNNVLNKPILAYKHNSWYMIYDGVHRTEANRRLGKETIKATIIIPNIEDKK